MRIEDKLVPTELDELRQARIRDQQMKACINIGDAHATRRQTFADAAMALTGSELIDILAETLILRHNDVSATEFAILQRTVNDIAWEKLP